MSIGLTADVAVLGGAGPVVDSVNLKGSYRTVADTAERDAIPANFRSAGMWVYTATGSTIYQLGNDLITWSVVPFGGGAGSAIATATTTTATALDDTAYVNGTLITINTFDELFVYNKNDTTTPTDGVTVIASSTGKRYYRLGVPSPKWARQLVWHIDETLGNDENVGATAGTGNAIASVAEFFRRIKNQIIATTIDIYVDSALTPVPDFPNVVFKSLSAFTPIVIAFHGTPTVVRSGTVTAYNPITPGTNSLSDLDDAGATATDRNRRIINTTAGARLNSSAWYGKNPNGVQGWVSGARITSDWGKSNYSSIFGTTTATPPLVGDTFDVQTLPAFPIGSITAVGGLGNGFVFDQLHITGGSLGMNLQHSGGMIVYFYNCDIDTPQNNCFAPANFINCSIRQGGLYVRSLVEMYAGIFSTSSGSATSPSDGPYSFPGGFFTAFNNVASDQARGATAQPGGWIRLNGYGTFNTGSNVSSNVYGSGINCNTGGVVQLRSLGGSSKVLGKFATRTGISVAPGGRVTCQDWTNVTITGGNNIVGIDFEINKVNLLQGWDPTIGMTGSFSTTRTATWANMNTAVGSGGFGGNAIDPSTLTAISQEVTYP